MEKKRKKDFRWRYQAPLKSQIGKLLSYIHDNDSHPNITTNEMMIKALSSYYMPNAFSSSQRSPSERAQSGAALAPEELKRVAYESVFALQSQIEQLMIEFNLDKQAIQSRKSFPTLEIEQETDGESQDDDFDDDLNISDFTYSV